MIACRANRHQEQSRFQQRKEHMSEKQITRRGFMAGVAAAGAAAALPQAASAQAAAPKAKLSTHVLDTYHGRPAAGLRIDFFRIDGEKRTLLKTLKTNSDGRTDELPLKSEEMQVGEYEFIFHIGDHFRAQGVKLPEPAFLDRVPVRFGIFDAKAGYHVPLVCTPWTYSTYRGS
jgi:5-hydroxyisourate hydrolase